MSNPQLPPIITNNLLSVARLVIAGGAAVLVKKGLITQDQTEQVVTVGSGIILALASAAWAWWQNHRNAQKLVAAAATGNPQADVTAPETKAAITEKIADPSSPISTKGS